VDYVFGSKQLPSIEFKPVDFSADKFMTDLYTDKAQPKSGEAGDQKGAWKEKNSKEAEPPKVEAKGDAAPGKPAAQPPAQPTVKPGGAKKPGKPADPNAKTAEGKSVKELQEEASKKGKKPEGKDGAKGAGKEEGAKKDTGKESHDKELQEGLAALEAVTARYAKDGATQEEVVTGVKAVRRKFKVFKSIEVIDGGETWDYDYVASPGDKKKGAKKNERDLRVKASSPEARLIENPATRFSREVAIAIDAAQEVMNDLYRELAKYGDGSSAFMVMKEQFEGGVGNPPKDITKGLHAEKCRGYIKGLNRHRPNLPPEAQARIDVEIQKMQDALQWADDYRAGNDPDIPRWAKTWKNQLGK
jgi:hypothetical protein